MLQPGTTAESRLAEILGALSLATDAAAGFAPETALRTALIAVRLGKLCGLPAEDLSNLYYSGLLRYLGCTGFAPEQARFNAGDDIGFLQLYADVDLGSKPAMLGRSLRKLARGAPPVRRAGALLAFLGNPSNGSRIASAHCAAATGLARLIGLGPAIQQTLGQIYERWDGTGAPLGISGEKTPRIARILHVAQTAEIHLRIGGQPAVAEELMRRKGGHLDPVIVDIGVAAAGELFAGMDEPWCFDLFTAAEPRPWRMMGPGELRDAAEAFGHFADLKSAHMLGHSRTVATLCRNAAGRMGIGSADAEGLEVAALLHDLGRVSVPSGIWDRPGPLSTHERDRVHGHPLMLAQILSRSALLGPFLDLAASAAERLDGSGYPARRTGNALGKPARLLAAADVFVALTASRAWRPAHSRAAAARIMADEVAAGRLDREAVRAVLQEAEVRVPTLDGNLPDGLSPREAEVLALLARGLSNRAIAETMHVSPRTVQTHVAHIFEKTGISGRAGAAIYAVSTGLANIQHSGG